MSIFADDPASDAEFSAYEDVLEWIAHPEEPAQRASHAIRGDEGVWVVDPLDVPALDERLTDFGDLAGVVVCSTYHARDAGAIARRHDVPVSLPRGFERVQPRVDSSVTWVHDGLGDDAIELRPVEPFPGWGKAILSFDDALYVPECLGTAPTHALDDERVGAFLFARLFLRRLPLTEYDPDRVFFGHGPAATEDASADYEAALDGARRRFPRALAAHGPGQFRAIADELLG